MALDDVIEIIETLFKIITFFVFGNLGLVWCHFRSVKRNQVG